MNDVYRNVAERADLTEEVDLDRLWEVVIELISRSTVTTSSRIEKAVAKCYGARTRLMRELSRTEEAAMTLSSPEDQMDPLLLQGPSSFTRQEDLRPEHLARYKRKSARKLAVELAVPEKWITDLRTRMYRERQSDYKSSRRVATDEKNSRNASVR